MTTGTKLSGQLLYERQKSITESKVIGPVIIATDISTPENIASISRVAEAAGCTRIIIVNEKNNLDITSNKIKKISRNTSKKMQFEVIELKEFIKQADEFKPMIALEITSASENIYKTKWPEQFSLVIGSEKNGVNDVILKECEFAIHIPMYGINGSMNVSHALAIALFEWRRSTGK